MGLGSGIRKKPIPDPGVKRHRIPDPQHWDPDSVAIITVYVSVSDPDSTESVQGIPQAGQTRSPPPKQ